MNLEGSRLRLPGVASNAPPNRLGSNEAAIHPQSYFLVLQETHRDGSR